MSPIRVLVWNEFLHEKNDEEVIKIYPDGMHKTIQMFLSKNSDLEVETATLDEPDHGLTEERIKNCDVMLWWGHQAHDRVQDHIVSRVHNAVLEGMGLIVLHSGHYSKILKSLLGTHCSLKWREAGEKERLWNIAPSHPITQGLGEFVELPNTEMYGERFDIPEPDQLVFVSWFEGGEVFRSGCCWNRGHGRIFYFRPGHESFPIFLNPEVQTILTNAVRWANGGPRIPDQCPMVEALEPIAGLKKG